MPRRRTSPPRQPAPARAHVVGAGLAGLNAAVRLAQAGFRVEVSDQAAQGGGRCRSYFDRELGLVIDNGNHLVLSGNPAVADYLRATGASDRLAGPEVAAFPYVDLRDGARWTLRPNDGPLGWWVTQPGRRIPGTRAGDYLPLLGLVAPPRDARVRDVIPTRGPVWERMLENFFVAVLNTEAADGSAALAAAVVRETLLKGGAHYRPRVAEPTLAAAFVDPALTWLASMGARLRLGRRLRALETEDGRVARLRFGDETVEVA
ncbi:MAG: FAD-dependent oxidoreductase, partial [Caulobacteraceae bacterium]|nr:FAD-dependent oxidoreductase [Caulobacter sp.]